RDGGGAGAGVNGANRTNRPGDRHLWSEITMDASDTLLDEDAATGCLRDGTTRSGLQPHARNERHGHPASHGSDQGMVRPEKVQHLHSRPLQECKFLPLPGRFYTAKTQSGHRSPGCRVQSQLARTGSVLAFALFVRSPVDPDLRTVHRSNQPAQSPYPLYHKSGQTAGVSNKQRAAARRAEGLTARGRPRYSLRTFNRLRVSAGRKSLYVFSANIGGPAAEANWSL